MNAVQIIGRLVTDPESKQLGGGTTVTNFTIAYNKRIKDKEDISYFFRCAAFGKTAETIAKFFHKGKEIGICGELQQRNYESKKHPGVKMESVTINVNQFDFIGSNSDGNSKPKPAQGYQNNSKPASQPQGAYNEDVNDIPF